MTILSQTLLNATLSERATVYLPLWNPQKSQDEVSWNHGWKWWLLCSPGCKYYIGEAKGKSKWFSRLLRPHWSLLDSSSSPLWQSLYFISVYVSNEHRLVLVLFCPGHRVNNPAGDFSLSFSFHRSTNQELTDVLMQVGAVKRPQIMAATHQNHWFAKYNMKEVFILLWRLYKQWDLTRRFWLISKISVSMKLKQSFF